MNLRTFLKLELKNFLSGKTVLAAIVCLLLAGVYAIYHGKSVIDNQNAILAQVPEFQVEHFKKQYELNKADLGNLLYYLQHVSIDKPTDWSAFSIGQRDVNPFIVKFTMLTLEGQLYNSELSNPQNLLYGNLDTAFVIVFLFPLLIIAFCHNLVSGDQENGIWELLRSQPASPWRIIGWRLAIRFAMVLLSAFGLISLNCLINGSTPDIRLIHALLTAFLYLAFWFALAAFVIFWQRSSTFNALSLLGVWIFLTILAPAVLNLVISTALPVSESFEVTISQREGYHQKWDKAKAETMQKFYELYPQYKNIQIPEDKFSWGWYYAAQLMGDIESANSTEHYIKKLKERDKWANRIAWFLPTVKAQLEFNRISKNDLESHLSFLEATREQHKTVREYFYPHIFREAKVEEVDWEKVPKQ